MRFDEHFLRGALSEISLEGNNFSNDATFSIDTRTLESGDIFIALKGSKVDGHSMVQEALKKGAAGIFISEKKVLDDIAPKWLKDKLIAVVPDTLGAFVKLAKIWRAQFDYPVVAITGSVGKTTTKEMVVNILETNKTKYVASYGNQNTKIGLCLNILKMRSFHEAAVFEVGISKRGEMKELVEILNPTTALITSVGHSHMEGLGSLTDIASEKRKIFSHFEEDSIGVINGDLPVLANVGYNHPVIKFGSKTTNQIQARKIHVSSDSIRFVLKIYKKKYDILLSNSHMGAVYNALAAAAIGYLLNIDHAVIVKGVQVPIDVSSRFEKVEITKKRGIIINDCYNASPESMKAALFALEHIDTDAKKIAVLGDMLELGVNGPFWHRQLGRVLRKVSSLKHVILVGQMVNWTKKTIPIGVVVEHVANWEEAVARLHEMMDKESLVLVKGSNGIKLHYLIDHFSKPGKKKTV